MAEQELTITFVVGVSGMMSSRRYKGSQGVAAFKAAVVEYTGLEYPPEQLRVFQAKKADRSWLILTPEHIRRMRRGDLDDSIEQLILITEENEMFNVNRLSEFGFPGADTCPPLEEVHVFVQTPDLLIKAQWLPEKPHIHDARVTFESQTAAFHQLQNIHIIKYNGVQDPARAYDWMIPLGGRNAKMELALNYIKWCNEMKDGSRAKFMEELCSCRTVYVGLHPQQFVGKLRLGTVMNKALAEDIESMIVPGTMPSMTYTDGATIFADRLVRAVGPIFVVLDGGYDAFGDRSGEEEASINCFPSSASGR